MPNLADLKQFTVEIFEPGFGWFDLMDADSQEQALEQIESYRKDDESEGVSYEYRVKNNDTFSD